MVVMGEDLFFVDRLNINPARSAERFTICDPCGEDLARERKAADTCTSGIIGTFVPEQGPGPDFHG